MTAGSAQDTIAALATSPTPGGIGVIRISGSNAEPIARLMAPSLPNSLPSHQLLFTKFRDADGEAIDHGFAVLMRAPRSYTTEDVVELHVHGGATNVGRLLRTVLHYGARAAAPGEFTLRAFLAGRIDLAQAEAVMDMVTAPTEGALDQAFTQLRGGLSLRVFELRERALRIMSRLEVQIDFVDEELDGVHGERPTEALGSLQEAVAQLAQTWHTGARLKQGAKVVLVGPPNAGKSSLFNALLRRSRAIVTAIPGTTRDYLEELADLGGVPVVLTDTAGLREDTDDVVEVAGIERTGELATRADLVLVLSPAGAPQSPLPAGVPLDRVIRVRTKADLGDGDVSVVTGMGIEHLIERIAARLRPAGAERLSEVLVTHERHFQALRAAATALGHARHACTVGEPPDLITVDVQEAVHQLGLVVGETTTEDLLDRIFGDFCIGK